MSRADDIFISMCKDILENGVDTKGEKVRPVWEDGTKAYTIKKFGVVNRYNLAEEFPALTLRKTAIKLCSLLLKGTDTEVTLQILLHELNVEDPGAITVPAGKLLDVVRHLPAQATIYCSLEKEQLLVKAAGSVFRIATLPAAH